ncbi:hypothetical protein N341_05274, partial [Tyto alba]
FLPVAQGHGCEDFDGICCLENHSESLHKKIQDLQQLTKKITEDTRLFGIENWLNGL